MPQHSKRTEKTGRSDLTTARQDESTYISKIETPALGNKAEWVVGAFARGVSFRELIRGSGLKVKQVLRICGLDPAEHINLVAELEEYRINLLHYRD
jgi:hypothetical protein